MYDCSRCKKKTKTLNGDKATKEWLCDDCFFGKCTKHKKDDKIINISKVNKSNENKPRLYV